MTKVPDNVVSLLKDVLRERKEANSVQHLTERHNGKLQHGGGKGFDGSCHPPSLYKFDI
jgi:hypothetical protein